MSAKQKTKEVASKSLADLYATVDAAVRDLWAAREELILAAGELVRAKKRNESQAVLGELTESLHQSGKAKLLEPDKDRLAHQRVQFLKDQTDNANVSDEQLAICYDDTQNYFKPDVA